MDLTKEFPGLKFAADRIFMWSPSLQTVFFDTRRINSAGGKIALLHEIGHATLGHTTYKYDMQLLGMEMDAWDFVRQNAPKFKLVIDESHIAKCIEGYDHWLSKRATCPDCANFSLQRSHNDFMCFACGSTWQVNRRLDRRVKRTVTKRFY